MTYQEMAMDRSSFLRKVAFSNKTLHTHQPTPKSSTAALKRYTL
jgi:hypothetical protein